MTRPLRIINPKREIWQIKKKEEIKITEQIEKLQRIYIKQNTRAWRKITKKKIKKNNKRTKRMVEKGRRKKNDGEATVTRRSRLLSRHSARLSRECSVIARDRAQDRYRAEPRASYQRRRCYRCDRWTEVTTCNNATWHEVRPVSLSLSPPSLCLSLSFTLSLFLSFTRYFALPLSFSPVIDLVFILACVSIVKLRDRAQLKNSTAK